LKLAAQPHISIISPVYKADQIIEELVNEIQKTMKIINCSYEIILIDDRSPDNCWQVMQKLSAKFENIKSIRLSKNFGENPAIIAGLQHAKGDWIVVMDCDLQDQPKEILKLYNKAIEGYDSVFARRKNRKDIISKKICSVFFSKVFGYLTDTEYDNSINNFGIYKRKVIKSVLKMNDFTKYFPLFVSFVGYNSAIIDVEHAARASGKSTYDIAKLFSLAFNVLISFSNKPLRLFVKFGMLISVFSLFIGYSTIEEHLRGQTPVAGYSSLMISIWFLAGVNITIVGIVGIYIGKIFNQSKGREPYIVDEILN
jgi:polyisoprenyl-phosphate glycosyltransferase